MGELIKGISVTDIFDELLTRVGLSREINETNIDSHEKLNELCKKTKIVEKNKMWIIVGTLQIISKRLNKIENKHKSECLINLVLLGALRFNATEHEHSLYYKLLLSLINECSKDNSFDKLLVDPTLPVKFWFNILTLSTDTELYHINLKFIEKILIQTVTYKK